VGSRLRVLKSVCPNMPVAPRIKTVFLLFMNSGLCRVSSSLENELEFADF